VRPSSTGADEPLPLSWFDFELPDELIAQEPVRPRHASRLLCLVRATGAVDHRAFTDLPSLLAPGDLLVVNRTRVIASRLRLRLPTGGKAELLCYRPLDGPLALARRWEALGKPGRSLVPGRELVAEDGTRVRIEARRGDAFEVSSVSPLLPLLERAGELPLPPYIKRQAGPGASDITDYQSVFAREPGAVAAPTASLHFDSHVNAALVARGVGFAEVVLHVGPGTFLPVRGEHEADVRRHVMHEEWYEVPSESRDAIAAVRARGGRIVAVGTTSLRALESWQLSGEPAGMSRLFVYPGFSFRVVDALVTNFHLPRSTLLMLVAAFAGRERVLAAYAAAVAMRYRFFSYGDAMWIG